MPRVVITGGAGFLGSHLCDALVSRGDRVVAIDNLLTGNVANIAHLMRADVPSALSGDAGARPGDAGARPGDAGARPGDAGARPGDTSAGASDRFLFVKHDVTSYVHVDGPVDAILHFASPASPIDYLELPIQTLKVGSLGTLFALGLARAKEARFLLASTSEVYGDPLVHPQPESYWGNVNPIGPRGVYDEAKRFAEALTMAYHRHHGLDTGIVRIFNTYGPRMRISDGRVVPAFIAQALRGEPLTVFGDGTQTRSFCFVDDLVRGILALLDSGENEPTNLGNPTEMTMNEFASTVLEVTGSRSPIEYRPLPEDDPRVRQPDISKARQLLGWAPRVELAEGLRVTAQDIASRLERGPE